MKKRVIGLTSIPVLLLIGFLITVLFSQAADAAGLSRSGRWLTYNGQPLYCVGFDEQQLVADTTIDYTALLNKFQQYGINKLRIWLICPWHPEATRSTYIYPWVLSGNKYDLGTWNSAYWTRLNNILTAAKSRDIIVEISLFPANYVDNASQFTTYSVWSKTNNVNGAFTANSNGTFDPDFFNLNLTETSNSGKTLLQYQEALVDKAVDDVDQNGFDNVYFEICNEIPGTSSSSILMSDVQAWQNFMADRVNGETSRLVSAFGQKWTGYNTTGIQYFWDQSSIDMLTFHVGQYDPDAISSLFHAAQTHGKVLQTNEGAGQVYANEDLVGQRAWGFFMSGGYFAVYQDDPHTYTSTDWAQNATRLEALRDIAQSVSFSTLSPVDSSGNEYDSLVTQGPTGSNWQVLADPGNQYVAYFWGTAGTSSVIINLPAGNYNFKFYDVRTPNTILTQSSVTSSGGNTTIASPGSGWTGAAGLALTIIKQASSNNLITNLSVKDTTHAAGWSIKSNIQSGDTLYSDRTYTIVTLPSNLAGSDWISPANDSKHYMQSPLVTFTVTEDSTVYVAESTEITTPSWLSGWTDTGTQMTNSQSPADTYEIYSKLFTASSQVSLGRHSDTTSSANTYIVIVKPTSSALITNMVVNDAGNAADWSIRSNIQNGNDMYGDRTYTIANLPSTLAGSDWIRPANDSKHYTSVNPPLVTFKVNQDSTVYIAHNDASSPMPTWLSTANGWTDTGMDMSESPQGGNYTIYSKTFSSGSTVSLGRTSTTDTNDNTYIIIVKPAAGGGGPTTLSSIADTYAKDGTYATTNYGTDAAIEVKTQAVNADREGFIKFDVSGIGSVSSATLRLYSIFADPSIQIDVYGVDDDSWLETTLDWNNKPAAVGSILDSQTLTAIGWYEWDVTSFVQSQLTDGTVSFELKAPNSNSACPNFGTKESANAPQLVITP